MQTLSLGEQLLATDWSVKPEARGWPRYAAWVKRVLVASRPEPVGVVFGQPLAPRQGDSVDALYTRYVSALQALAAAHDAKLELL